MKEIKPLNENGIRVQCKKCGFTEILNDYSGWCLIILEHYICTSCGYESEYSKARVQGKVKRKSLKLD